MGISLALCLLVTSIGCLVLVHNPLYDLYLCSVSFWCLNPYTCSVWQIMFLESASLVAVHSLLLKIGGFITHHSSGIIICQEWHI